MQYIQISIEAGEEQQEILVGILSQLNATGFEQTTTHLYAYFNENNFPGYEVNQILKQFTFQIQTLKEQNWNKEWESNFHPVMVNDFCGIRADFHAPIKTVQHEIIITPKMSFGTRHHATTYLMIEQMKELEFKNKTVFDFGTGTGILAILAEKLGAASVSAIDADEWSIENAQENIAMNKCNKISVHLSSVLPNKSFNFLLANINKNVILENLPHLKKGLEKNGHLLLSGLLSVDEKIIVQACTRLHLKLIKQTSRNNWISLVFVNGN